MQRPEPLHSLTRRPSGEQITLANKIRPRWEWLPLVDAEALFVCMCRKTDESKLVDVPDWFPFAILDKAPNRIEALPEFDPAQITSSKERTQRSVVRRQGQPEFRAALLDAYGGACAISGCTVEAVLEAAHIVDYDGAGTNHVQNGLLLRADLHTLFDAELLAVDPETLSISLDQSLMSSEYRALHGTKLRLPKSSSQRPSSRALRTRRTTCGPTP